MTEGVEIQAQFEANGDKTNFTFKVVHPTAEILPGNKKRWAFARVGVPLLTD